MSTVSEIGSGNTLNFDPGTQLSVYGTQIINAGQINVNGPASAIDAVTAMLTNSGNFDLLGPKDMATLGGLTSNFRGFVDVDHGGTLQINGNADNLGTLYTSYFGSGGNNPLNITGNTDKMGRHPSAP